MSAGELHEDGFEKTIHEFNGVVWNRYCSCGRSGDEMDVCDICGSDKVPRKVPIKVDVEVEMLRAIPDEESELERLERKVEKLECDVRYLKTRLGII